MEGKIRKGLKSHLTLKKRILKINERKQKPNKLNYQMIRDYNKTI